MVETEQVQISQTKERCAILIGQAHPDLYRKNTFRVLAVPVDASDRQISRQVQKLRMRASTGWDASNQSPDEDFVSAPPPESEAVQNALQRVRDPELRIVDEFFWFWPGPADTAEGPEILGEILSRGDHQQANDILKQYDNGNKDDPVLCHNSAILAHALALEIEVKASAEPLTEEQQKRREFYWRHAYAKWRACLDQE